MKSTSIFRTACLAGAALFLAACQIDAGAPMRSYDIKNVSDTSVPVPVKAVLTATFASESWCEDEGAMAIQALSSGATPIRALNCMPAGRKATGQFGLATMLVRTAGAHDPSVAVEQILGNDLVRFAVFPHSTQKHLLSVGIFLNLPKFQAAKAQLLAMPVFREGGDTAEILINLGITVTNDLPGMATFYLAEVKADGSPPADEDVLRVPQGGSSTITLDADTQALLMQQGWVNFFTMDSRLTKG